MDIQDQTKPTTPSDATKLFNSPTEAKKADENHTKDVDKNDINIVRDLSELQINLHDSDTKHLVSLAEDKDGSHKDNLIDSREDVYVLSVPNDIPLVDNAETLIDDFKDHKTIYYVEDRSTVDTFEVKPAEENILESQTSVVSIDKHGREVIEKAEIAQSDPVLTKVVEERGKAEELQNGDGKVLTGQDCGVDASVGSSSRNSIEGNWGSVSVLSTTSIDAENPHFIGKPEISPDKSRLGKPDPFEDPSSVKPEEQKVDQNASETKAAPGQDSQPPKPENNDPKETEGRKRNEEAIAKVTNWSTGEPPKDEKSIEPEKSKLTSETPKVNQVVKGRGWWVPFGCCSTVNVN